MRNTFACACMKSFSVNLKRLKQPPETVQKDTHSQTHTGFGILNLTDLNIVKYVLMLLNGLLHFCGQDLLSQTVIGRWWRSERILIKNNHKMWSFFLS